MHLLATKILLTKVIVCFFTNWEAKQLSKIWSNKWIWDIIKMEYDYVKNIKWNFSLCIVHNLSQLYIGPPSREELMTPWSTIVWQSWWHFVFVGAKTTIQPIVLAYRRTRHKRAKKHDEKEVENKEYNIAWWLMNIHVISNVRIKT